MLREKESLPSLGVIRLLPSQNGAIERIPVRWFHRLGKWHSPKRSRLRRSNPSDRYARLNRIHAGLQMPWRWVSAHWHQPRKAWKGEICEREGHLGGQSIHPIEQTQRSRVSSQQVPKL